VAQVRGNLRCRDAAEVETLAAAEHGGGDFVRLGGGQDEARMRRRLLERLEQRVEGRIAQHVHFVNDVDFVAAFTGPEAHLLAQLADVVYAVVAGRVDLDQVEHAPFVDGDAGGALVAGALLFGGGAVEGLGQDAGGAGLACATRSGEEIRMRDAVLTQGVAQGLHDMLLPDHLVEGLAAPLAIQRLSHGTFLRVSCRA